MQVQPVIMDIRSIIDTDTPTAPPAHSRGRKQSEPRQGHQQPQQTFHSHYEAQLSSYNESRETKPTQPPPLQPLTHGGSRSPSTSSYHSVQSPYQHTPSSTLSGGQYPFPQHTNQSPAHGFQASPYNQRESHTTSTGANTQSYSATTPVVLTPLAISPSGPYAYSHPRQTSSHSTSTPTSAQNQIPNFFRESPQGSQSQMWGSSQSHSSQQYVSQPGTPLGPPPIIGRPFSNLHRESPGSREHQRSHSGGSHGYQQALASSPRTDLPGSSTASLSGDEPGRHQSSNPALSGIRDRERSLSVSPKTRIPSQLQIPPSHVLSENDAQLQLPHKVSNRNSQAQSLHGNLNNLGPGETLPWSTKLIPTKRKTEGETQDDYLTFPQTQQSYGPSRSHAPSEIYNVDEGIKTFKDPPQIARHSYSANPANTKTDYKSNSLIIKQEPLQSAESLSAAQQRSIAHPLSNQQPHSSKFSHPQPSPASYQPQLLSYQQPPLPHQQNSPSSQQQQPVSHQAQSSPHQISQPILQQRHPPSSHQDLSPSSRPPNIPRASPQTGSSFHQTETLRETSNPLTMSQSVSLVQEAESKPMISSLPSSHIAKRRTRPTEIPIYAQSIRTPDSSIPKIRQRVPKPAQFNEQESTDAPTAQILPRSTASPVVKGEAKHQVNGHPPLSNMHPLPKPEPLPTDLGPLGPWEPSIINIMPSEEIIRVISDFLFAEVVCRDDVGAGPAGGGAVRGAVLEVEAKIGQLIDKNSNDRLRLPVMTECVVSKNDPSLRLAFKSSMTEAQHRSLNEFLNKALVGSQTPKPNPAAPPASRTRAAMSYVHTYECDSFFELSQSGALSLPASIRAQLNPRNTKAKVRITTDQKTGKEIARIVKARIADIDIYCPRTPFDWRVSVNVEMNFDGDLKIMTLPPSADTKRSDRNKDRMSYRHQAYQIDLTQVTPTEVGNSPYSFFEDYNAAGTHLLINLF